jgi:hypothetical protein
MENTENSTAGRKAGSGASRFFTSYYIANALLIMSFALVHRWFLEHSDMKYSRMPDRRDLLERERQASTLLLVSLSIKFFRRQSLDAFFSDAFSLSKGVIALLSFYMDIRVFAYYLIMYISKKINIDELFQKDKKNHFPASLSRRFSFCF